MNRILYVLIPVILVLIIIYAVIRPVISYDGERYYIIKHTSEHRIYYPFEGISYCETSLNTVIEDDGYFYIYDVSLIKSLLVTSNNEIEYLISRNDYKDILTNVPVKHAVHSIEKTDEIILYDNNLYEEVSKIDGVTVYKIIYNDGYQCFNVDGIDDFTALSEYLPYCNSKLFKINEEYYYLYEVLEEELITIDEIVELLNSY